MNQLPKNNKIKKLVLGSVPAFLVLFSLAVFGYFKIKQTKEAAIWVNHTLEVIAKINDLESSFHELGATQRGYVITANKSFRDNFYALIENIPGKIDYIEEKIKDNPSQYRYINKIKHLYDQHLDYYNECIELIDNGKPEEAAKLVSTGKGQNFLNEIKGLLSAMNETETNLLNIRLIDQKNNRERAVNTIVIGTLFALTFILCCIFIIYQTSKEQDLIAAKLHSSSEVQKAILQSAAFALIATDKNGRITLFNPAAEKLLGHSVDDIMGKDPLLFHRSEEIKKMAKILTERFGEEVHPGLDVFTMRARKGLIESEPWTYVKKDGSHIPVMLTVTELRDQNNQSNGFIAIVYDISLQRAFEEALIKAKEEALEGNKAKSEFLANMSHEIRTPMNAIMGMAELLRETPLSEDQLKYVEVFQQAGNGLLNIINDILDLSKIEAGHFELEKSPFELSSVVERSVSIMALKAHQKQLELAVDVDDSIMDRYLGDGNRLRQIILNLLGNAIKFTHKGEVLLKISAGKTTGKIQEIIIEVIDTGIGMSQEIVQKLFQRFSQADSSITKEFGGTGLGLNITKNLVELMEGEVEVESEVDHGTKVKITLNLEIAQIPLSQEKFKLENLKTLIVDDTKTNRVILRKILEGEKAIVSEAETGEEALALLSKERFDLVLLDGRMPGINGFETAEAIFKDSKTNAPMLMMLTSDDRPGDLTKAKLMGLKSYLVKPILKKDLLAVIEKFQNAPAHLPPSPSPAEDKLTVKNRSLLLVDDNDENRLIIRSFLKKTNWQIDEAKNGQEALALYQQKKYEVILMDMQMPIMDGYTATREIRKIEKELSSGPITIYALTAYALKEEMIKSAEAGCSGHLTKPISKSTLIEALSQIGSPSMEVKIDPELEELIPEYLEARRSEIIKLDSAIKEKDFKTIQIIGHKLRGTAGSYGFKDLSVIGKELEEKAMVQDLSAIETAQGQYKHYMSQLKVVYA